MFFCNLISANLPESLSYFLNANAKRFYEIHLRSYFCVFYFIGLYLHILVLRFKFLGHYYNGVISMFLSQNCMVFYPNLPPVTIFCVVMTPFKYGIDC